MIEQFVAYKILLSTIKKEYDDVVDCLLKHHYTVLENQDNRKHIFSEPSTFRNYQQRIDQLEERLFVYSANKLGICCRFPY